MLQAVTKAVGYMEEKGLSEDERLQALKGVSQITGHAAQLKAIFDSEGLTDEEQNQAVASIRAMIKPRKKPGRKRKGEAAKEAK